MMFSMKRYYWILLLAIAFAGCISNDIPYPVVKGDVLEIAFRGQVDQPKISTSSRKITVEISDTVNIEAVMLTNLKLVDEGTADIAVGKAYNLSQPYSFTVNTYQKYEWVIEATQQLNRHLDIEGQVGASVIDVTNHIVIAYIPTSKSKKEVNVTGVCLGSSKSAIRPNLLDIHNYEIPVKVIVTDYGKDTEWTVVVQQVESTVESKSADSWATFATLSGSGSLDGSKQPGFVYRKKVEAAWTAVDQAKVIVDKGTFTAKVDGLTPGTDYVFCATVGSERGAEVNFKTEMAPSIENLDFDSWHMTGSSWYPNAEGGNSFWGTGNEGVTISVVNKPSNSTPSDDAVSGKAARLETISVPLVKLAAGNLFTGKYKTNLGDPIKSVTFGRPYTGRPTKLEGYYKYSPKVIDVTKDPYNGLKGTMDRCHIYIRLENWGTATERPADPEIIAYGELQSADAVAEYKHFSINIKYSVLDKKPTHVVLVATASYMGDFFTGGIGSVLYVDDFEFKFD